MNEDLVRKWANYFDKLLNCEQPSEIFPPNRNTKNDQICLSPSLKEVKYQIQKLKNHKSPEEDEIVAVHARQISDGE